MSPPGNRFGVRKSVAELAISGSHINLWVLIPPGLGVMAATNPVWTWSRDVNTLTGANQWLLEVCSLACVCLKFCFEVICSHDSAAMKLKDASSLEGKL